RLRRPESGTWKRSRNVFALRGGAESLNRSKPIDQPEARRAFTGAKGYALPVWRKRQTKRWRQSVERDVRTINGSDNALAGAVQICGEEMGVAIEAVNELPIARECAERVRQA